MLAGHPISFQSPWCVLERFSESLIITQTLKWPHYDVRLLGIVISAQRLSVSEYTHLYSASCVKRFFCCSARGRR